ncbi:hypothetical protein CDAR_443111 [Caerostris darwini]|uniref:Uncharacterized protein n=1 Tax=Caerostris darwini TaxID=1538125 RepID=A0AAV4MVQ7_9ARAC|nr:hypothetical protein CDAR_443111 [Caerostris darwini]
MVPGGGLTYWKQALTGTKGPSRVLWCLSGIAAAIVHWYCKPSGRRQRPRVYLLSKRLFVISFHCDFLLVALPPRGPGRATCEGTAKQAFDHQQG